MPKGDQHKGAAGKLFEFARNLRKEQTPEEKILWEHLKNRQLNGFKFRRQHPLYNFILDFYCHEAGLVIELDGSVHDNRDQQHYDMHRTLELEEFKLCVLRFKNDDVRNNLRLVLYTIKTHLIKPTNKSSRN